MSAHAPPRIPILDLKSEVDDLWAELLPVLERVLRSGEFILGSNVKAFEAEVARDLGARHAIGVNSGTDALVLALRALDIGPGDEVITTAYSFFATAEAISLVGANPVFVDIDPRSFTLDAARVERAVTPRTRAILPVHLYGQCADMDALLRIARERDLRVVEDVAQAMGATHRGRKAGTMGDVGCYSFFPSKNLGAYGDGGLVTTQDDGIAERIRMLRAHGAKTKYHNETLGYNSRLDEIQAAILRVKLPRLAAWNDARRAVATAYRELLADAPGIGLPEETPQTRHVYHQFTIRSTRAPRDALQRDLLARGIGTMVYYPVPMHKLPVYAARGESFPESERAAREVLSLPMGPYLPRKQVEEVVLALRECVAAAGVP